jgi:Ca-activated chloride channel family protein
MANNGKLALSRDSIAAFLGVLGEDDAFEVMTFNVQPTTLFNALTPASEESRLKASEFLDSQSARGGTVLKPALTTAFRYGQAERPLNVVILSDGMTEQQERAALLAAASGKPASARIFCIGVGNDVNRPLLEQLAEDAGGLAAFISQGDDFNRQAEAFRRKLTHPVASNLKVEFADAGVYDVEPKRLPNLYFGMPVRLYGRYRTDKPVSALVQMDIDGQAVSNTLELNWPKTDAANPEIERMWAWHRVQSLLKEADRNDARSQVSDEIVRLGEGYSIVTEYTSFIVLENDAEYKRWKIDRRNAVRTTRDRKAHQDLAARLEAMRDQAALALGPAAAGAPKTPDPSQGSAAALPPRPADMFGPDAGPVSSPIVQDPAAEPAVSRSRERSSDSGHRGFNINIGKGKGGGAIDPLSAVICLGVAALAASAGLFKKQ